MLLDASLLIQDVQLLCFAVIFGFVAWQHWEDRARRWLWYSFLVNAVGAVLDFTKSHLPFWLGNAVGAEMIPLSYALLNTAIVYFLGRMRWTQWISVAVLLGTLPFFLHWRQPAFAVQTSALGDLAIAIQVLAISALLLCSREQSTRAPRRLMSAFLFVFSAVEFARVFIAFALHHNPDVLSKKLELISIIAYIVSTSVLPLAFIWMMNARLETDLIQKSLLDPLTQVLNRRGLYEELDREIARSSRYGENLTVVVADLDHFKRLNDTFGHAAGDAVLIGFVRLLVNTLRRADIIARIGGEEFVLLLPHAGLREAQPLLERLRIEVSLYRQNAHLGAARVMALDDADDLKSSLRVTASFGATVMTPERMASANELLREADLALYRAKNDGRNRVHFFSETDPPAIQLHPEEITA
jgi:diguanylate cyclase (GGDEF)-like protein